MYPLPSPLVVRARVVSVHSFVWDLHMVWRERERERDIIDLVSGLPRSFPWRIR